MRVGKKLVALRKGIGLAQEVHRDYGVSVWRQAYEMSALRRNQVGVDDYYFYNLFDPATHPTMREKRTYTGWRAFNDEFRHFSDPKLQAVAYHKHLLYRLLGAWGLPVPEIYALYEPRADGFERHRALTTREDLAAFLRTTDRLPCFGKPSNASAGYGGRAIMAREEDGRLRLIDETRVTPEELAADLDVVAQQTGTYLITEFLRNNDQIRAMCGDTTASVRVVMLVRDGVPEFFRAGMMLPAAGAHVSNCQHFATGALFCRVDLDTGEILSAMGHGGPHPEYHTTHPTTGAEIVGHRIECWQELRDVVRDGARAMSPFRMQHWDFALTRRGPVVLEMNFIGDVAGCQLYGPPGLYTEQYLTFRDTNTVW